jgi:hypothetical protein
MARERLTEMISLSMSSAQKTFFEKIAEETGRSFSAVIRHGALNYWNGEGYKYDINIANDEE